MRALSIPCLWIAAGALLAGCNTGPGDEPAPTPLAEDTATASFALTAQCAGCAAQATQAVCGPQALACLQDPNCANAAACVQNCAPTDAMCIAACYQQGAQVLADLADCVVCQECPTECAGAWPCGGGGGGGGAGGAGGAGGSGGATGGGGVGGGGPSGVCDNKGMCQACVACATVGPCMAQIQACAMNPQCLMNGQLMEEIYDCTVCSECANDCAGVTPPLPNLQCGP